MFYNREGHSLFPNILLSK